MYYAKRSRQKEKLNRPLLTLRDSERIALSGWMDKIKGMRDLMSPEQLRNTPFRDRLERNRKGNQSRELAAAPQTPAKVEEEEEVGDWTELIGQEEPEPSVLDTSSPETGPTEVDESLREAFARQQSSPSYQKMLTFRRKLPAYDKRTELLEVIGSHQVIVISGETGCGKTTQVPQFILDHMLETGQGSRCKIVCTQPRRISAISIGERVADERGETCGGSQSSVGYQIRYQRTF